MGGAVQRELSITMLFVTHDQQEAVELADDVVLLLGGRIEATGAPVWQVYSPGTLLRYALLALRGATLHRPVEDTRQMGGDTLVVGGRVVRLWRPSTPDDRASPALVAAAARARRG